MSNKFVSCLYDISRKAGKCASVLNDVDTLAHGDIKKYLKRRSKRKIYKMTNKTINKIFK